MRPQEGRPSPGGSSPQRGVGKDTSRHSDQSSLPRQTGENRAPPRPPDTGSSRRTRSWNGVPADRQAAGGPFRAGSFRAGRRAIRHTDCLVTAPTGSGKTWIADSHREVFLRGGRACFLSLKALTNSSGWSSEASMRTILASSRATPRRMVPLSWSEPRRSQKSTLRRDALR